MRILDIKERIKLSKIDVELVGRKLIIRKNTARYSDKNIEEIDIDSLKLGKRYKSLIKITNDEDKNKVLFIQGVDPLTEEENNSYDGEEDNTEYNEEKEIDYMHSEVNENNVKNDENDESDENDEGIEEQTIQKKQYVVFVYSEGAKIKYAYYKWTEDKAYKEFLKIRYWDYL